MKGRNRSLPRNCFKIAIATAHVVATTIVLFVFPVEAFYLSTQRQQAIPVPTSLFLSQEAKKDNEDSKSWNDSQNPSLRRYQGGGMIKPVVIAAKPEPTSNFVKVNGQDTYLKQRETEQYPGMFRPTVVKTEDDEITNDPMPIPVDESVIATNYITGGLIGAETEKSAVEEDKAKAEKNKGSITDEILEDETIEADDDFPESIEMDQKLKDKEETTEGDPTEMSDEEIQGNEPAIMNEVEEVVEEKIQESETSKSNESTDVQNNLEKEDDTEIEESIINEMTIESEAEKKTTTTHIDTDALEKEELEKIKAIEAKIQIRKQQQVVLDKIERDLLQKTDEIKKRKEELVLIENDFSRAEKEVGNTNEGNEEIQEQGTKEEIPYYSPKEYNALSLDEKVKLREARAAMKKTDNDSSAGSSSKNQGHPLLGPVVADLGYKRVHVVSSGRLGTIPIWKKQRTYRYDRVKRMATEKEGSMHLGFPGVICLNEDAEGKLSIIDGQHRVGMMQALRESRKKLKQGELEGKLDSEQKKIWDEQENYFQNVLVEVYSEPSTGNATKAVDSDSDYTTQVFQEINMAQPMALTDVQHLVSEAERTIISKALSTLQHLHKDMFSSSQRCRPPNVNADSLRSSIIGSRLLKRHGELTTDKKLADWLVTQNAAMGKSYEMDSEKQKLIEPKAWMKASTNGFYLGLENTWLFK